MKKTKMINLPTMQIYAECGYKQKYNYPVESQLIPCKNQFNKTNGFAAKVFMDKPTKQIVIAISGTDLSSGVSDSKNDISNDLNMVAGNLPPQYESALALYNEVREKYPDIPIILTGHSLGGSICQVLAKITGELAITFNAFSTGMEKGKDYSNIINIINSEDFISMSDINTQPGKIYVTENKSGNILMPKLNLMPEEHYLENLRILDIKEYKRNSLTSFFDKIRAGEEFKYYKVGGGSLNAIKEMYALWDSVREMKDHAEKLLSTQPLNVSDPWNSPYKTGINNPIAKTSQYSKFIESSNSKRLYGGISNADGHWVTINGNHVLIED